MIFFIAPANAVPIATEPCSRGVLSHLQTSKFKNRKKGRSERYNGHFCSLFASMTWLQVGRYLWWVTCLSWPTTWTKTTTSEWTPSRHNTPTSNRSALHVGTYCYTYCYISQWVLHQLYCIMYKTLRYTSFMLSWHIIINNFRQKQDMSTGLAPFYSTTALVEAAKSLAPSNVKWHGKVPYKKLRLN